jgi:hypothetical protein
VESSPALILVLEMSFCGGINSCNIAMAVSCDNKTLAQREFHRKTSKT